MKEVPRFTIRVDGKDVSVPDTFCNRKVYGTGTDSDTTGLPYVCGREVGHTGQCIGYDPIYFYNKAIFDERKESILELISKRQEILRNLDDTLRSLR